MSGIETILDPATELELVHSELEQFKSKVRKRAIEAYHDNDWCLSELNGALIDLGLIPYAGAGAWTGTAKLSATIELQSTFEGGFTRENALQYIGVISNDSEVRATGDVTVLDFAPDSEDKWTFTMAVEVPFRVVDTSEEGTAESWAQDALELEWTRRYIAIYNQQVLITEQLTADPDPDAL